MNDYLRAFFTEYKKNILNPDCGIRNLKAAIEFKYEPDTAVTLLLGATQTSMKGSTDGNGCWYCEVPNGIDFTSADAIWQLF